MNDKNKLTMAERRAAGLLWVDTGESMKQQIYARGLCQDFNQTRATDTKKRNDILKKLLAFCGDNVWIESPLTLAMGNTVSIGDGAYIQVPYHAMCGGHHVHLGKNVYINFEFIE